MKSLHKEMLECTEVRARADIWATIGSISAASHKWCHRSPEHICGNYGTGGVAVGAKPSSHKACGARHLCQLRPQFGNVVKCGGVGRRAIQQKQSVAREGLSSSRPQAVLLSLALAVWALPLRTRGAPSGTGSPARRINVAMMTGGHLRYVVGRYSGRCTRASALRATPRAAASPRASR